MEYDSGRGRREGNPRCISGSRELAKREKRSVSAQAAYLIEQGLGTVLTPEQANEAAKLFARGPLPVKRV